MNIISHKKCYARNFGAVDAPKYTILARPSSQGVSESSVCPQIIPRDQILPGNTTQLLPEAVPSSSSHLVDSTNCLSDAVPSQNVQTQPVCDTHQSYFTAGGNSARIGCEQSVNNVSSSHCNFIYEKTPVSKVNDLSRFNKIPIEFSLVAEEGLPHEKTYYVQLVLGGEVYHGSASNMKKAQHNVATMALERTRYPHPQPKSIKLSRNLPTHLTTVDNRKGALHDSANEPIAANNVAKPEDLQFAINGDNRLPVPNEDKCEASSKSVINEVQELAVKMGLLVTYDTVEEVPAPNTRYHISCTCGSLVTHGSALSKKAAKKDAATNMLASLKNMVPVLANSVTNTGTVLPKKSYAKKKKAKSLVNNLSDLGVGAEQSELSCAVRLYQVQQAKKGTLPVYTDIGDVCGNEFRTEVSIDGTTCTGVGRTKKLAKQDAARQMLVLLGFPLQSSQETGSNIVLKAVPVKSALKKGNSQSPCDKKVTFCDLESHEVLTTHATTCPRILSKDCQTQSVSPICQPRKVQILKRPAKDNLVPVCERACEKSCEPTSSPSTAHQNQSYETSCGLTLLSLTVNQNLSREVSSELTSPCSTLDQSPCCATSFESMYLPSTLDQSQIFGTSCDLKSLSLGVGESHFCETSNHTTLLPSMIDENKYSDMHCERTSLSSTDDESCSTPGFHSLSGDKTSKLVRLLDANDKPATERLHLIAASLCIGVQYTDVPKSANGNEYVSIVSVSTSPPLVNHGVGPTFEFAREAACHEALEMLRELDFLKDPIDEVDVVAAKIPEC